jgi:hypothetical protein
MKTYLTDTEFSKLFWDLLEKRMSKYDPKASQCDRILWNLFQEFEKDIKETLEGSMWNIDEFTGDNAADLIGYQFHKTFRQTDVIDHRYIDAIIWQCLQDAPVFWLVMNRACKILASEDAAELYKEEV